MVDFLFYVFAALTALAGFKAVFSRNAIDAAMSLIVCLLGIAALFVLLEAFFLAALQVLIYAGAIVVLFLFIIMLLGNEGEKKVQLKRSFYLRLIPPVLSLLILCGGVYLLFAPNGYNANAPELNPDFEPAAALSKNFGYELFTRYLLPFQVAGFLLLIAVVGILAISKETD